MTKYFLAVLFATLFASTSFAQHADIEFGFEDPAIPVFEIELDEFTDESIGVAEGELEPFGNTTTLADNPGFMTPVNATENLTVGANDQVFVRVLDASAPDSPTARGVGFVNFYNPVTNQLESLDASDLTFTIRGNTVGSSADTNSVFAGDQVISGPEDVFLATASDGTAMSDPPPSANEEPELLGSGEIHNHLTFIASGDLANTPSAIGLLLQFSNVRAGTGEVIDSEPFFLIFNNGLTDMEFAGGASQAFGLGEVLLGDANQDGVVDFADIPAFIAFLQSGDFLAEADINGDGTINFGDIPGFIAILMGA